MFTKLLSNIIGSIIKSSDISTDIHDRDFDIRKTLKIVVVSLLITIVVFLVMRIHTLSDRIMHYHLIKACESAIIKYDNKHQ